jgi:anti-sigma B factor antagonist
MGKEGLLQIANKDNYNLFKLSGKFVGDEETEFLKNELENAAKQSNNKVVIDFSEVTYFSSLALGILVKEDEVFNNYNGKLVICNVPGFLTNIFVLTKLSSILNIFPNLEEAVAAL